MSEIKRQEIFHDYWGLGDHNLQSSFINSAITINNPVRKTEQSVRKKSVSCTYELAGHRVCKEFFLKTLDETSKRIQNIINNKNTSGSGISPKDKRGHKAPGNKIPEMSVQLVKEHIQSFPRYTSHYSREQAPNRKYLNPGLNLRKLYVLYKEFCQEKNVEPVKESFYRHIFNTSFNLSFHRPLTDTCITCDKLQVIIEHGNVEAKTKAEVEKELHLRKSETAQTAKRLAGEIAKEDSSHVALCFDLQKMLPTPVLSCSRAYYARQLWTYNFCVHNLKDGNAVMFMWNESQAARGCKEIASCLLKFILSLPSNVAHLTAFSDNAGGQNKSHFIVKFWFYVIRNTNIQTVDHKFLVSGHSFMECDQNFGLIENAKKNSDREVFVPEHWETIVAKANKKFMVVRMTQEDFITLESLKRFLKDTVPGIRKMQWLHFKKNEPWTLFYKENLGDIAEFSTMNLKTRQAGRDVLRFPELGVNEEQPKIKYMKFKNLQDLLPFVPPVHHDFYNSLQYQIPTGQRRQTCAQEHVTEQNNEDDLQLDEPDRVFESDSD